MYSTNTPRYDSSALPSFSNVLSRIPSRTTLVAGVGRTHLLAHGLGCTRSRSRLRERFGHLRCVRQKETVPQCNVDRQLSIIERDFEQRRPKNKSKRVLSIQDPRRGQGGCFNTWTLNSFSVLDTPGYKKELRALLWRRHCPTPRRPRSRPVERRQEICVQIRKRFCDR